MRYRDVEWEMSACGGLDGRLWFPDASMGGAVPDIVKRICRSCDIREDCLQYAVDNDEVGMWGGVYFAEKKAVEDGSEGVDTGPVHGGGDGDNLQEVPGATAQEMPSGEREHDGAEAISSACGEG